MQYDKIKKRPVQFLSIAGLNLEDFNFLLPHFKTEWDEYNDYFTLEGKPRQRRTFARIDTVLPMACDKLLFLLVYFENQPITGTSFREFWHDTIIGKFADSLIVGSFA